MNSLKSRLEKVAGKEKRKNECQYFGQLQRNSLGQGEKSCGVELQNWGCAN